jgi:uncharacterized protein YjiS (DUF1127 family)
MTGLINRLKAAGQKRSAYRKIVDEIQTMSRREADELGISRSDAHRIAQEAIYG